MQFAATWMDTEIIILSEVSQGKTNETNVIRYHIYVESKYIYICIYTNEPIYKTEINSQT